MNLLMPYFRQDDEVPQCIAEWGWKYHHIGIPTNTRMPGEQYLPALKFYVSGFTTSHFGIEWMRFDEDCPLSGLIKSVPHIAFEVENLDEELKKHNFEMISEPGIQSERVRIAMIAKRGPGRTDRIPEIAEWC